MTYIRHAKKAATGTVGRDIVDGSQSITARVEYGIPCMNKHRQVLPKQKPAYDPRRVNEVSRMAAPAVLHELVELLGARITAAIGAVSDTRHVRAWENGEQQPQRLDALKTALQAARLINDVEGRDAARGWFSGCNAHFGFQSPVQKLLENTPESRTSVVAAAHQEVSG